MGISAWVTVAVLCFVGSVTLASVLIVLKRHSVEDAPDHLTNGDWPAMPRGLGGGHHGSTDNRKG